jgi:hypothetical protein
MYMAEWRYSSTILDLGTRWKWVVSFTPVPIGQEAGLAPGPEVIHIVEKKEYFPLLESNPDPSVAQPCHYTNLATFAPHLTTWTPKWDKLN